MEVCRCLTLPVPRCAERLSSANAKEQLSNPAPSLDVEAGKHFHHQSAMPCVCDSRRCNEGEAVGRPSPGSADRTESIGETDLLLIGVSTQDVGWLIGHTGCHRILLV